MSYIQLNTRFFESPKVTQLTAGEVRLLIESVCYVNQHKTDGWLPTIIVTRHLRPRKAQVEHLIEHGFWVPTDTGYDIKRNPNLYLFWTATSTLRLPQAEWVEMRSRVFERDDYTCTYCGERGGSLECDHVVPVSRSGSNDESNLVTACKDCNRSKGAKLLNEWVGA